MPSVVEVEEAVVTVVIKEAMVAETREEDTEEPLLQPDPPLEVMDR